MVSFMGSRYELRGVDGDRIERDELVRVRHGSTTRRVVGFDGDDVLLRGVRSKDIVEAVSREQLVSRWVRLVPVDDAR